MFTRASATRIKTHAFLGYLCLHQARKHLYILVGPTHQFGIKTVPYGGRLFKFRYADEPWYGDTNLSNFFHSVKFLLRK